MFLERDDSSMWVVYLLASIYTTLGT